MRWRAMPAGFRVFSSMSGGFQYDYRGGNPKNSAHGAHIAPCAGWDFFGFAHWTVSFHAPWNSKATASSFQKPPNEAADPALPEGEAAVPKQAPAAQWESKN
jgi:hypothetical protein